MGKGIYKYHLVLEGDCFIFDEIYISLRLFSRLKRVIGIHKKLVIIVDLENIWKAKANKDISLEKIQQNITYSK